MRQALHRERGATHSTCLERRTLTLTLTLILTLTLTLTLTRSADPVSRYSNSALLNIMRMYTDPRTKRNYKGQEAVPRRINEMNLKSDRR